MSMKHHPGKVLPGEEKRTFSLDYREITERIGEVIAGTINVLLEEDLTLGQADAETENYRFWKCKIADEQMIADGEPEYDGWIIKVKGEDFPMNFVEILAKVHIRTALKKTNWPSYAIEISL